MRNQRKMELFIASYHLSTCVTWTGSLSLRWNTRKYLRQILRNNSTSWVIFVEKYHFLRHCFSPSFNFILMTFTTIKSAAKNKLLCHSFEWVSHCSTRTIQPFLFDVPVPWVQEWQCRLVRPSLWSWLKYLKTVFHKIWGDIRDPQRMNHCDFFLRHHHEDNFQV